MPETLYAAACNPPRRAKRISVDTISPQAHQHRPILPMQAYSAREITGPAPELDPAAAAPTPGPAKRGRKPGPLSRTAREAQRRLNHSIIEKARRTKINDALATLKQLVPPNYVPGQMMAKAKSSSGDRSSGHDDVDVDEDEDENDEDDDEYDGKKKRAAKAKQSGKGAGKKEEKEKEFKLEILVRTVSFLQDLLEKVNHLEAEALPSATCTQCGAEHGTPSKHLYFESSRPRKRKHADTFEELMDEESYPPGRQAKIPRRLDVDNPNQPLVEREEAASPRHSHHSPSSSPSPKEPPPPISSWLHNPTTTSSTISNLLIDPQLLRPSSTSKSSPPSGSYLPSPPNSTHFDPVRSLSAGLPPVLSLGPGVSLPIPVSEASISSSSSSSRRTPEDESAASLLLQIASSPTFRPVPETLGTISASSSPVFRGVAGTGPTTGASSESGPVVTRRDRERERALHGHERDPSLLVLSRSSSSSSSSGTRTSDVRSELVGERKGAGSERERTQHHQQAQTPSSLLGLNLHHGVVNMRRYHD